MDTECSQTNAQEGVVAIPWTTFQPKVPGPSSQDDKESPKKVQDAETEQYLVPEASDYSEGDLSSCVVLQKRFPLVSQFSWLKQVILREMCLQIQVMGVVSFHGSKMEPG